MFTECGLSSSESDTNRQRVPRSWSSYGENLITETQVSSIGDRLWAGKPSRYRAHNRSSRSTQPSIPLAYKSSSLPASGWG